MFETRIHFEPPTNQERKKKENRPPIPRVRSPDMETRDFTMPMDVVPNEQYAELVPPKRPAPHKSGGGLPHRVPGLPLDDQQLLENLWSRCEEIAKYPNMGANDHPLDSEFYQHHAEQRYEWHWILPAAIRSTPLTKWTKVLAVGMELSRCSADDITLSIVEDEKLHVPRLSARLHILMQTCPFRRTFSNTVIFQQEEGLHPLPAHPQKRIGSVIKSQAGVKTTPPPPPPLPLSNISTMGSATPANNNNTLGSPTLHPIVIDTNYAFIPNREDAPHSRPDLSLDDKQLLEKIWIICHEIAAYPSTSPNDPPLRQAFYINSSEFRYEWSWFFPPSIRSVSLAKWLRVIAVGRELGRFNTDDVIIEMVEDEALGVTRFRLGLTILMQSSPTRRKISNRAVFQRDLDVLYLPTQSSNPGSENDGTIVRRFLTGTETTTTSNNVKTQRSNKRQRTSDHF
jgi:hypothetical protein